MITFRDLTDSAPDIRALTRFYDALYAREFPDPDERESLSNMIDYLGRRARGWYGSNNYHILLAMLDGEPVGGSIADYLAEPNVGVIEYLFVASTARRSGIGRQILARTESLLGQDARRLEARPLDAILAEMNDPLRPSGVQDNLDPATRALIWDRWGYAGLDFPYVQPALSAEQDPVTNLIVIAKPLRPDWRGGLPADTVRGFVHEYLRWAMRIDEPAACPDYVRMAEDLGRRARVGTLPLAAYLGRTQPMHVHEITGPDDADFALTMATYTAVFHDALAVDEADFRAALAEGSGYHLWSIRRFAEDPIEGLASFRTMSTAGFGGYLALTGGLRRTGLLRPLVARMEDRMLRDRPTVRGWYAEVGPDTDPGPFRAIGFHEIAVDYRQPIATAPAVPVRLLYKEFGRCYGPPNLSAADVVTAVREILALIYRIPAPDDHPTLRRVVRDLPAGPAALRRAS